MFEDIISIVIVALVGLFCALTAYIIISGEKEEARRKKKRKHPSRAHHTKEAH